MSERFACRVLGQHRSTQCKSAVVVEDEAALTAAVIALALQFGRYGYRRITALLRHDGWTVNVKRDELLAGAVFYTLEEDRVVIEQWRRYHNSIRPHASLGYHPPAPEAVT